MRVRNKLIFSMLLLVMLISGTGGAINNSIYAYSKGESVYVGGMPIGITMSLEGLMVVGITDVITEHGAYRPSMDSGIECGDIITNVCGKEIKSFADFEEMIEKCSGELLLNITRGEKKILSTIMPAFDVKDKKYRVGLWLKNTTAGIGTVTYMRENGEFAALGHPIMNSATKQVIKPIDGKIYNCKIVGVSKGAAKKPGELKGLILKSQGQIGVISDNNKFGLFGKVEKLIENQSCSQPMVACGRGYAKVGNAQILTTVDEGQPKYYDIFIIKTANQKKPDDKGLVIKVIDKQLLETSGGIVQGMSGSPIVQNGKLIGAVTHVFINDPTRGYGMYIDWML